MITFLAALVLLTGQSTSSAPQGDLLRQIVPKPTGANGYEDYLRAASMVNNPQVAAWMTLHAGNRPEQVPDGLSAESTYLAQCQWVWERYGKVADLVRSGNGKPIFDPRTDSYFDRKYQEFRHFRTVVEVLNAGAYYELARGNTAAAARLLCDAMRMNRQQYRQGPLIAFLYSITQSYSIYTTIGMHWDSFSEADLRALLECAKQIDADPPAVPDMLLTQYRLLNGSLNVYLDPKSYPDEAGEWEDYAELGKLVKSLSEADRNQLLDQLPDRLEQVLKADSEPFGRSEPLWPLDLDRPAYQPTGDPKRDIPQYISRVSVPSYGNAIRYVLVSRTQARLVAMNCQIRLFQWKNERLPASLAEAGIDPIDPINGKPFVYDVTGNDYDLYSHGRPEIGRIDLAPVVRVADPTNAVPPNP